MSKIANWHQKDLEAARQKDGNIEGSRDVCLNSHSQGVDFRIVVIGTYSKDNFMKEITQR